MTEETQENRQQDGRIRRSGEVNELRCKSDQKVEILSPGGSGVLNKLERIWYELRIGNAEDAKSVVRKYFIGTRSRHGRIISIIMDEEAEGPDERGAWKLKGTYTTEEGGKEAFTASVTSRGEVVVIPPQSKVVEKSKPRRR